MPHRILYVDHAPVYGGAETALVRLATALDRRRYEPHIALGPCPEMERILASAGLSYRVLALRALNRRDWRAVPSAGVSILALRAFALRQRVDLIHTNTLRTHMLGAVAAPAARRPLIWTLHDLTCPPQVFRLLHARATAIICVSQTIRDAYSPFSTRPQRMCVIYNGVEPPDTAGGRAATLRSQLGIAPNRPIVAAVGRLVRGKGQDVFLRAAAELVGQQSDPVFVIAGGATTNGDTTGQLVQMPALNSGGATYEADLHALARQLGLADRVRFTGFLGDPAALYAAAAVVVHPGTMPEGLPTVPIEAMSAGRPVVATDLSAVREIVDDGVSGLVVPGGDPVALAHSIATLLADPARAAAMGEAGKARATRLFDLQHQVTATTAVYDNVLAERRR